MCRFFWTEIPGKSAEYLGKRRKYPARLNMTEKRKNEVSVFFLEMVIHILKWRNLKKMDRNQTNICPGQKFVTNEYPGINIYTIYIIYTINIYIYAHTLSLSLSINIYIYIIYIYIERVIYIYMYILIHHIYMESKHGQVWNFARDASASWPPVAGFHRS